MEFINLHDQNNPLLICNVWDVASARIAEKLNFRAIGTSSAAIASLLGYTDGENMSFTELVYLVKRIATNTNLPLTVDLESGYSRESVEIADYIRQLADLGVVGVNLEDSVVYNERTLLNAEEFAQTISDVKKRLEDENINIFLNVRTDTFLLEHPTAIDETKLRAQQYEAAGADGIFVPCIEKERDIQIIVESTTLPVNVMCIPNLPSFQELKKLGVKRISMGNFFFDNMYKDLEDTLNATLTDRSFKPIFTKC